MVYSNLLQELTCHIVGSRGWQSQSPGKRKTREGQIMRRIGSYEEKDAVTSLALTILVQ